MTTPDDDPDNSPWWGTFQLDAETGGRWHVGPSTLWLYRTEREWRLFHHRPTLAANKADPFTRRSDATVPVADDDIPDLPETPQQDLEVSRYSFSSTKPEVAIQPALADRPVVSRPEHPLHIPPGESITLYLSTPLWIRVFLSHADQLLHEVSSNRMSDTWFGVSTTEGELCYATRTAGRLQLDSLPARLHRAITPLRISNTAEESLLLERVQLPTRHLELYSTDENALWTQTVRMNHSDATKGADVNIRKGPPSEADGAQLLQEPRDAEKRGLVTSTFGAIEALFGT